MQEPGGELDAMRDHERNYAEDSELSPRVVHNHYSQSKNGNGNGGPDRATAVLLTCLLGVVGFMGVQVWMMNGRMAAFEATLSILVQRSGVTNPP